MVGEPAELAPEGQADAVDEMAANPGQLFQLVRGGPLEPDRDRPRGHRVPHPADAGQDLGREGREVADAPPAADGDRKLAVPPKSAVEDSSQRLSAFAPQSRIDLVEQDRRTLTVDEAIESAGGDAGGAPSPVDEMLEQLEERRLPAFPHRRGDQDIWRELGRCDPV